MAAAHHLARQRVADDPLGLARDLEQSLEVDAGLDADLVAQVDEVLGGDVAGRVLEAGVRAAAEPGDRRVEIVDAHFHRRQRVGEPEPAGVVQVQVDALVGPAVLHLADHPPDRQRIGPAHGVGELDEANVDVVLAGDAHQPVDQADHVIRRDVAFVVAAERRHHAHFVRGHVHLLQRFGAADGLGERLLDGAVGVLLREGLARRDAEAAFHVELAGARPRAPCPGR